MVWQTLARRSHQLSPSRQRAAGRRIVVASCMSQGLAASMAAASARRLQAGRQAIAELSLEETQAAFGSEVRAKMLWKMFREGRNPFDTEASHGGLGRVARETLYSLDPAHVLAEALRPEAVEVVANSSSSDSSAGGASLKSFSNLESEVRQELGEDCGTRKILLRLQDGAAVECVLIPQLEGETERRQTLSGRAKKSTTLCVSAQVGCAQGCHFCRTASMGIIRNLEPDEILAQVIQGRRIAHELCMPRITNVVFMGMGEPLANLQGVLPVVEALIDSERMKLAASKVTVSTVGPSPSQVRALGAFRCKLAWSLHCVDPDLRKSLVGSARFAPEELRAAFLEALCSPHRAKIPKRLMVAVVLLRDINDSGAHAQDVARFLRPFADEGVQVILDLIPYNDADIPGFQRPAFETVLSFKEAAYNEFPGLLIYIRHPRGENEYAACGQLATAARSISKQTVLSA